MIFIDFFKAREEKNKYGMIALTFNRSTKLSHIVPNGNNKERMKKREVAKILEWHNSGTLKTDEAVERICALFSVVGRFYTEAEIKEIKETEYKKGLYFEGY